METIEDMHLEDKEVFLVIGASRTGKGTLLEALTGTNFKFIKKKDFPSVDWIQKSATLTMMAPEVEGNPVEKMIVSHSFNSHTLKPKLVSDPPKYGDHFCGLDKFHMVDYPGMFESKGPELDSALYLGIQKILLTAKSARVLVLVSAQVFEPDNSRMLNIIT